LSTATGSRVSHPGDPIEATIIAPVSIQGRILVPQGSRLLGSIVSATAFGLGLKESTASIRYGFDTLLLPGEPAVAVNAQLVRVETAKEHVDDLGTVQGIHPIVSVSSSVDYCIFPLLLVNPAIGAPIWGLKHVIAPSANPEIHFPAGTEVVLRLSAAVTLPAPSTDFPVPAKSFSPGDLTNIQQLLEYSAQRAYMGGRPSDIINVLFIGSRSQMDRVFHASGWSQAETKSPRSLYRMYLALTKRSGYSRAPMNALVLNGAPSAFVQQKSLDTVQKRHHVRLWQYPWQSNIWLGAAAEDVGFRFELAHWTHSTDPNIDRERAKIVNDLAFAGCIEAAGLLSRTSADLVQDPKAEYPILTDGDIAAIRLNDCIHPNFMPGVSDGSALNQPTRLARALAAFRDDLVRSNIVFTTYNTVRVLSKHKTEPTTPHTPLVNGEPRGLDWLTPIAPLNRRPAH
jgi:LssY C-terminus